MTDQKANQMKKEEKQEYSFSGQTKPDLAQVIATGLVRIMREGRTQMVQMEADFDAYVATLSFDEKKKMKLDVMAMVTNARLAVESIYVRVQQSF